MQILSVKVTYLPVSFNLPNTNIFLLQTITNCVLGGIKENKIGGSMKETTKDI